MGNPPNKNWPTYSKLEKEIEVLKAKCALLDIGYRTTKTMMVATIGYKGSFLDLKKFPQHDYDPWMFEHEFLTKAIETYMKLPKV